MCLCACVEGSFHESAWYMYLDERSVQGQRGKEKMEDEEKKKEGKEHIGIPKENVRWIGMEEGQNS